MKLNNEQWTELKSRYIAGELASALAREFGMTTSGVLYRLKREGVTMQSRSYAARKSQNGELNESVFDELTPEACYWVGFLLADGCVTGKNRIELGLATRDREHIVKFKEFLGATNKIYDYVRTSYKGRNPWKTSRLRVNSTPLTERLAELGISPRKSFNAAVVPELQDSIDFWRGTIDGDGHIKIINVPARLRKNGNLWRPRTDIRLEFVGSKDVMESFKSFTQKIAPTIGATVRKKGSIFRYSFSGENARKVINTLYKDSVVALDRKLKTAKEIAAVTIGVQT